MRSLRREKGATRLVPRPNASLQVIHPQLRCIGSGHETMEQRQCTYVGEVISNAEVLDQSNEGQFQFVFLSPEVICTSLYWSNYITALQPAAQVNLIKDRPLVTKTISPGDAIHPQLWFEGLGTRLSFRVYGPVLAS